MTPNARPGPRPHRRPQPTAWTCTGLQLLLYPPRHPAEAHRPNRLRPPVWARRAARDRDCPKAPKPRV